MIQKGMLYTAVLVGTYLAVAHATAFGTILKSASGAYNSGVKTLQGR